MYCRPIIVSLWPPIFISWYPCFFKQNPIYTSSKWMYGILTYKYTWVFVEMFKTTRHIFSLIMITIEIFTVDQSLWVWYLSVDTLVFSSKILYIHLLNGCMVYWRTNTLCKKRNAYGDFRYLNTCILNQNFSVTLFQILRPSINSAKCCNRNGEQYQETMWEIWLSLCRGGAEQCWPRVVVIHGTNFNVTGNVPICDQLTKQEKSIDHIQIVLLCCRHLYSIFYCFYFELVILWPKHIITTENKQ
jgi:hypothetical protein